MALFQIVVGTYEKVLYGWVAKARPSKGKEEKKKKDEIDSDDDLRDALRDDCTALPAIRILSIYYIIHKLLLQYCWLCGGPWTSF